MPRKGLCKAPIYSKILKASRGDIHTNIHTFQSCFLHIWEILLKPHTESFAKALEASWSSHTEELYKFVKYLGVSPSVYIEGDREGRKPLGASQSAHAQKTLQSPFYWGFEKALGVCKAHIHRELCKVPWGFMKPLYRWGFAKPLHEGVFMKSLWRFWDAPRTS